MDPITWLDVYAAIDALRPLDALPETLAIGLGVGIRIDSSRRVAGSGGGGGGTAGEAASLWSLFILHQLKAS